MITCECNIHFGLQQTISNVNHPTYYHDRAEMMHACALGARISFLSNRIEELTEAFNEGLLTDDDKDANRNEEEASQDLLLDDDDEDEIIGQTTTPIFIDFEGLELFRRELSKKFDLVI